MMKPIVIAQIGTMHDHARFIFESISKQTDYFQVIGLGLPEGEEVNCDVYKGYPIFTVDELLNNKNLQAVTIECDERYATEYALQFAKKGIAVHLDKPGTDDLESFIELISYVKSRQIPFSMGYMYRFNPVIKEAIEIARSGELGEIRCVEAHMGLQYTKEKREWLKKFPGGMMYFLGCHLLDLVMQIQGVPKNITPFNYKSHLDGVDSLDQCMAVLNYENGSSFIRTSTNEPGGFARRQLVITGNMGTIEIRPLEVYVDSQNLSTKGLYTKRISNDPNDISTFTKELKCDTINRYNDMMKLFYNRVVGLEKPCDYDYELQLFETLKKCY